MNAVRHIRLDSSDPAVRRSGWHGHARDATALLTCDAETRITTLTRSDGRHGRTWRDPLAALRWMAEYNLEHGTRWMGFLSYDLGREFETVPDLARRPGVALPLFAFALVTTSEPVATGGPDVPVVPATGRLLSSTFSRRSYEAAVARCVEYVAAGDVFQVNLSQRFTAVTDLPLANIYSRLLRAGGATYGSLLEFDDFAIVSNSPELLLRVTPDRRVITRPIKGTRLRSAGMEAELLASGKDAAELNMIIDLERNDLGRVCAIGTVRVTQPRTIEAHPTVYHGVATVEGVLRPDVDFVDLLRATFPGGSVTGAPKIRAMEIIEELEPVRRGAYCGAIGYLAADRSMQFNVAIRTMTFADGAVHVPVGGGVVAESDPAAEYRETLVKARAMFDAIGVPREAYDG